MQLLLCFETSQHFPISVAFEMTLHEHLSIPLAKVAYTQQIPGTCQHMLLCYVVAAPAKWLQWIYWLKMSGIIVFRAFIHTVLTSKSLECHFWMKYPFKKLAV